MSIQFKGITMPTQILNQSDLHENKKEPWAIDRVGRFILGIIILIVSLGIIFISSYFVILLLLSGANLAITSITNKCAFNKFLKKFGFKEREEIYAPSGQVKNQKN